MYTIIIPFTKYATEIKHYKTLRAFNAALVYYKQKFTNNYSCGEKSHKFFN